MAHDSAAAGVDQVRGAERLEGIGRLARGLAGGEDGHDFAAGVGRGKHGRQAGARGGDDGVVRSQNLLRRPLTWM